MGSLWRQAWFSPDGRHVAYDVPLGDQRDVYCRAVEGGDEKPLVQHAAFDRLIGWDALGSRIVFASNRRGEDDLWVLGVREGSPVGEPEIAVH